MLYVLFIIAFVLTEYKIKNYIENNKQLREKQELFGGRIIIEKHYNKGAFLNFMEDKKEIVKIVSSICLGLVLILFAIILPKKGKKLYKLGLSLVLGGAISNVADRLLRGYVIDYFSINCNKLKKIVFNLADMAIFLGSFLLLLASLFSGKDKRSADKIAE